MRWCCLAACSFLLADGLWGQSPDPSLQPAAPSPPSVSEKWRLFENETFSPLTLGAGAFNAAISQATNSAPLYGRDPWPAYAERFGSAIGDIATQNFFGDFVLASALHEDTRYVRLGPSRRLLRRVVYSISRSWIARTDAGNPTFNFANVGGSAMSAAVSNLYYPPASRNGQTAAVNWATDIAGSGFANLLPEFWPDVRSWVGRHTRRSPR